MKVIFRLAALVIATAHLAISQAGEGSGTAPALGSGGTVPVVGDGQSESSTGVRAPTTGQFFYVEFDTGSVDGEYYLRFKIGTQNQEMKAWLTTSEHDFGVVTTKCGSCHTSNKFDMESSKTCTDLATYAQEQMVLFNGRSLQDNTLLGHFISDKVSFSHLGREFGLTPRMMAVTGSQTAFSTAYQGYIGLAPPLSLGDKKTSVLTQAKDAGLIDHLVFSLYTNLDKNIKSSIKFGSYDKDALAPSDPEIVYVKTAATDTWALRGYAIIVHYDRVKSGPTPKQVLINPQLPYMYLPKEDWASYAASVLYSFGGDGVICSGQYCFFNGHCQDVAGRLHEKKVRIVVFHDGLGTPSGTYQLVIGGDKLFIPGDQVGLGADRCVLGVFEQTEGRQDAWYLGNIVLADYYMIFDMTPLVEHGEDFLQIGFGQMNPAGLKYEEYPDMPTPQPSGPDSASESNGARSGTGSREEGGGSGGAAAAVIIILLLVAIAGALFYLRRRRQQSRAKAEEDDDVEDVESKGEGGSKSSAEKLLSKNKSSAATDSKEKEAAEDGDEEEDDDVEEDGDAAPNYRIQSISSTR